MYLKSSINLASSFKKDLELLPDIDMLLLAENRIRGELCHSIDRYAKANNKYMKHYYNKNEEPSYLKYWDITNLYDCAMLQKLPVDGFKWVEDQTKFNKGFIKNYNEKCSR